MFTPEVGSLATSQLADQALVSTIVDLSGSSSLKYSIGGLTIASTTDVSFTYPSPAQITGILKTSQVFNSVENGASTVHVVYTVADQFGRTQCSPSDVTVTLTVGTASSACFVFSSPLRPHGSCSLTVEPSTFGSSASALPVLLSLSVKSVVVQASSVGTVALAPFFVHDQPSHVGIYFQMPIYQAVPGDTFTVDMWAQTGSSSITMESWGVSLVYDFNLVSFVNVVHPLYNTVLTSTAVTNALNITGSGGSGNITGWFLAATLSFTVLPAAAGTTLQITVPPIITNAMTNDIPLTYFTNFSCSFADSRGSWAFPSGLLDILLPVAAGIFTFSTQSSFLNTLALNGVVSMDDMSVYATYNTGREYVAYADVLVQPDSCTSSNTTILTATSTSSGCLVVLASTEGAYSIAVSASYNGFSSSVSYRAFYFLRYHLNATRSLLRSLGCDYETSYLSAYGEVTLDGAAALATLDLSNLVLFSSSNISVLRVSGRIAQGVSEGMTSLTFGANLASTTIAVSSEVASVVELVSYVYSDIAVQPLIYDMELGESLVRVQPLLSLTAEEQTAAVVTYARHDDGVWTDVSQYPALTLSSNEVSDLAVSKNSSNWQVTVPVGASSLSGDTPALSGTLRDSCSVVLISSGLGYARTNLSIPVAILVTADLAYVARPDTPAATALGILTSTQIHVMVTFRSALGGLTYKDFTLDFRTNYTTYFVNSTGLLSSSAVLSLTNSSGLGTAGSIIIEVNMPSYAAAAGLTGTLNIPVVDVNTAIPLQGILVHSMTPSVPVTSSIPLAKLSCTGVYQTGLLDSVLVTLTDGTTRSGSPSLSSANTSVATVSGTTVTAVAPGTSVITATYATATGTYIAYVTGSTVDIASMSLSYDSSTLSGHIGSSMAGSLSVHFSDETSFGNVITQCVPLLPLIEFNSSDYSALTMSATGVAGLVNNSWQWAILSACSKCGDGQCSTFVMAGNLAPAVYDTKLGSTSGITFPPASMGQNVDTSIKVQVSSSPLTTYQVWLFYNSAVFGTPTIIKGSGWSTGAFDFTTGNVVSGSIVKAIISFSSGSSAINTLVNMASVTFPVITNSAFLELISANVVALSVTSGIIFQSATGIPIVAGAGYVSLNGGILPQFRRLLFADDSINRAQSQGRQLLSLLPLLTGDCNGDNLFNANDATYAQQLVTNGISSWPVNSLSQMRNCAPTYSYMFNNIQAFYVASDIKITIADVSYLLHASTNRLFFLNISSPYDLVTSVPTANDQPWTTEATLYYFPSSTSVSAVMRVPCSATSTFFEMNLASMPYTTVVGSYFASTAMGVAFQAACTSGLFSVLVLTNYQSILNMSVGFVNAATGDAYAFCGMDVGAFVNPNANFGSLFFFFFFFFFALILPCYMLKYFMIKSLFIYFYLCLAYSFCCC